MAKIKKSLIFGDYICHMDFFAALAPEYVANIVAMVHVFVVMGRRTARWLGLECRVDKEV